MRKSIGQIHKSPIGGRLVAYHSWLDLATTRAHHQRIKNHFMRTKIFIHNQKLYTNIKQKYARVEKSSLLAQVADISSDDDAMQLNI